MQSWVSQVLQRKLALYNPALEMQYIHSMIFKKIGFFFFFFFFLNIMDIYTAYPLLGSMLCFQIRLKIAIFSLNIKVHLNVSTVQ